MDLYEIDKQAEKIQNKRVLKLIDLKVENEMKAVIDKLDSMQNHMDTKFESVFREISTLRWYITVIAVVITLLGFAATLVALLNTVLK